MSKFNKTPFTANVWDLMHQPGELRERELDIVVPEKMGEGLVAVQAGATLEVDARLESLHDGILATVRVDTEASGVCGRCLKDIEMPVRVEFAELFAYSLDEAFDYQVEADHVDLEPLIRDAVVLALPFQPVCRPDCPGLDPVTGERLEDLPERAPQEEFDSRWSALTGLLGQSGSGAHAETGSDQTDREASTDTATDGETPSASPTEREKS
ncbi:hypothetical protein C5B96_07410 [Subtercola sp. Z020]|uniref:YceD family protein n=1 Tax=Subtercola sp. Z020 TaxID=2080582 RepID=UPI000CE7E4D9|nr:DUF177 domain-containing protein [Subtercola sp. Z020]PPF84158.1 hypothetical protein C5B96_07410 [Subtercola sp. Z020]